MNRCIAALAAAVLGAAPVLSGPAASQTPAATPDSAPPRYLLPDLPRDALILDGRLVWLKAIFGLLGDYTWFDQDSASRTQVGTQDDQADLRSGRFGFSAHLAPRPQVELFFVVDYIESKRRVDQPYDVLDLTVSVPFGATGKLTIGKQKQPFVYELVALAALLPQQERLLSPFFVSRDVGVRASGGLARQRVTLSAGWFNDWFTRGATLTDAGNDYAVRITAQPVALESMRAYLHVGVGGRYTEAENGTVRFRGRPESNVADYYIDTGDLPASHAMNVSLELLAGWRQWALLAEWAQATVHGTAGPTPRFAGAYVSASWTLTGEQREYDWRIGGGRNPIPRRRGGAWELVGRYGHVDAADQGVDGGVLDKWYVGLNWWASQQWKVGAGYGVASLERGGLDGRTAIALTRLQWLY